MSIKIYLPLLSNSKKEPSGFDMHKYTSIYRAGNSIWEIGGKWKKARFARGRFSCVLEKTENIGQDMQHRRTVPLCYELKKPPPCRKQRIVTCEKQVGALPVILRFHLPASMHD